MSKKKPKKNPKASNHSPRIKPPENPERREFGRTLRNLCLVGLGLYAGFYKAEREIFTKTGVLQDVCDEKRMLRHLLRLKQFTAFGGRHTELPEGVLARNVDVFSEVQIKHILLEMLQEEQTVIDEIERGVYSEPFLRENVFLLGNGPIEIRRQRGLALTNTLLEARQRKIKIHAVDRTPPNMQTAPERLQDLFFEWLKAEDNQDAFVKSLSENDGTELLKFIHDLMKQRGKQDIETASIITKIAEKDKAVVLYGNNHMAHKEGIAASLGRGRTLYVRLCSTPTTYRTGDGMAYPPDAIYFFGTKQLIITQTGYENGITYDCARDSVPVRKDSMQKPAFLTATV